MNTKSLASSPIILTFLVINGLFISGLVLSLGPMSIIVYLAMAMILLFFNAPIKMLMVLLFLLPFSSTRLLQEALIPIPGFKPLHLFAILTMVVAFKNIGMSVKAPISVIFFFGIVIVIFAVSIAHSYFYLDQINAFIPEPLTPWRYFLSKFLKPLIFILPAVFLTKFIYRSDDFDKIAKTIDWSLTLLSIYIIYLYLSQGQFLITTKEIRDFVWDSLGTHSNNLANFYIMGFPFVLYRFFQFRRPLSYIKILLSVIGIALLFSRSAYVLFLFSIFLYILSSKRVKVIPLCIGILVAVFVSIVPDIVIERATKGFDTNDKNEIFAGRIEGLWKPLIDEYASDPKAILIGRGRYAILSTNAHKMGNTIQAQHPHNMYLEAVLDTGVLGLSILIILFVYLLIISLKLLPHIPGRKNRELMVAVFTSLFCFLLSGMTDRTFFPDEINGYLWIIVSLSMIITRYVELGELLSPSEQSAFLNKLQQNVV